MNSTLRYSQKIQSTNDFQNLNSRSMNKNFNNSRENLQNSDCSPLKENLNVIFQENDNIDS